MLRFKVTFLLNSASETEAKSSNEHKYNIRVVLPPFCNRVY